MKKIVHIVFLFATLHIFAQVGINTSTPHASSILDITSTTKGFLFPRMTQAQRNAITSPAAGLVVWCSNCGTNGELQVFDGVAWTTATGTTASIPPDVAPSNLTYSGSPYSCFLQTLITPIEAPSYLGGTVTSFSVSPSLPSGLVLNTTTGEITGTPTVLSAATDYTITATNGSGSTTAIINIAVNNAPPPTGLAYSGSPYVFTYGSAITPVAHPTNNGGAVASYSITPSLPAGLTFNTTSGAITGTPTVVSSATNYTVTATNPSGSTTAIISITVNNISPTNLQYTGSPFSYFVQNSITPIAAPTNTGGIVTAYAVSPALPSGLTINTSTGAITGTPTVAVPATNYTITASNATGSTTATINITVNSVLDLTGINNTTANVAYSLRKLSSSYTGAAIRVRRSSDNAEQNIGFDMSGNLDQSALTAFVGSGNGFVTTWYDQSGKGKNVTQTTNANQPKIVSNGTIITRNGKPMMNFESGTSARLVNTSTTSTLPVSMVNVAGVDRVSSSEFNFASIGGSNGLCLRIQNGQFIGIKIGSALVFTNSYASAGQLNVLSVIQTSSTGNMFLNGTQATITAGGSNGVANPSPNITIGAPGDFGASSNDGFLSESIFYSSLLSTTDRQALEANQAAYYGLIPAFTYPSATVATYASAVTINPSGLANTGTFTVSPSLPSGLTINATTGVISGTPTVVSGATTYTVSSTTGLGVGTSTFNLTVNDIAPALTYANTNLVLNDPATISPTITSGMVAATYSITPSLPSGLSLNSNTGVISGTPTAAIPITTFTITATNSGGVATATLNLYVGATANPTNLVYTGSPYAFAVGATITPVSAPTNQGGVPTSYSIAPALPNGLAFDTATGAITGYPTVVTAAADYTVTATNPYGSTTATINIAINEAPPANLQYTGSPYSYYVQNAITPIAAPTNTGGMVTAYSVSPALPSGLVLNTTTGTITGTPAVAVAATDYTITASNVAGSTTTIINITVSPVLDLTGINTTTAVAGFSLRKLNSSYSGAAIRVRRSSDNTEQNIGFDGSGNLDQMALLTFVGSGNGFVTTWYDQSGKGNNVTQTNNAIQPQIVANGSVITRNGKLVMYFQNAYLQRSATTVGVPHTMVNVGGIDNSNESYAAFSAIGTGNGTIIEVDLYGQPGNLVGTKRGAVFMPTNAFLTSLRLNSIIMTQPASAPTEIFFNGTQTTITSGASNGVASPSAVITVGAYGDLAQISSGAFINETIFYTSVLSNTDIQTLEANHLGYYDLIPSFTYPSSTVATYGDSVTINPSGLSNTGMFTVSPALPSGLTINATTGIISGIPTVVSSATTYTVSSTTGLGVGTSTFTLTINDITPALTYANTNLILNDPATISPTITSGMVSATYSITPSLPTGLNLDTNTGVISGTPTTAIPLTTFTITATNSGGVGTATLNLYVGTSASPTNLTYTGSPFAFAVGSTITPINAPTNQGGAPTSYSIAPSLPNGLAFDTATGAITGYPTVVTTAADYTVTATNASGSTTATINIEIIAAQPTNLQYSGSPYVYYMNNTYSIAPPINSGGTPTLYAINPSLPLGLVFNSSTGAISGTPTVISSATTYTITASNGQGSTNTSISIEIYPVLDLANLNITTTASAYSLRKLNSTYTGAAIRVRRSSDNTEQNIGFDGVGNLDQASLLSFVGSGDGFVTVWYDQTRFANNMTQTNVVYQPRIVNAGVIETVNSKPAVYLNTKYMSAGLVAQGYPSTINGVATSKTATSTGLFFAIGSNNGPGIGLGNYVSVGSTDYNLTGIKGGVAYMPTSTAITPNSSAIITLNTLTGGAASTISLNGSSVSINAGSTNNPFTPTGGISIGSNTPQEAPNVMMSNGYVQEAIFISGSLTTLQKQALENNQGAYYGVTIN
ncbi:putative Ig domain-containing protein [Flavobacterium sp. 20NA77.7]|uniref:Ig domain-containing protein n=1 Tax=Flavobacterium nakdongensis TaxID=3073563 RepID=A0ABY9R9H4_9FLAO|nr:putative Ig domain-containing protein [Flavobacterium sp. 20NA77.7]WMW77319.1 putative Ig domain-containing protein [Flavobacterium sp. 20NA77.7]